MTSTTWSYNGEVLYFLWSFDWIFKYYLDELRVSYAQAVQCLTTGWTTGRSGFDPRQGQRIFPLTSVSRPALGPTHPSVQWVPGVLSQGLKRGRGVTLTTHTHLVPRSWMSRSYSSSSPSASMACSRTALLFTCFVCAEYQTIVIYPFSQYAIFLCLDGVSCVTSRREQHRHHRWEPPLCTWDV
jgi:hypothetical protein